MARKNGPTPDDFEGMSRYGSGRAEVEDYSEARAEFDTGDLPDSACLPEPDVEQESPFLRAKKRPAVRRGPLPKRAANRLKIVGIVVIVAGTMTLAGFAASRYAMKSRQFRVESSDQIQVTGNQNVTRSQIVRVFGADISRNVLAVPLQARERELEQISWIESATIMRYLPNRLAVVVKERTPVAFVQVESRIALIDANGVVMDMPTNGATKYSFPVIMGFTDAEPLSTRSARMKIFTALVQDLDSGGARYSQDLSEVDLSDPEDAKVTVADGGVIVHLGDSNYLERYKVYVSHVQEWKQQYGALRSVDLRYDNQVVVDPLPVPSTPSAQTAKVAQKPTPATAGKKVVGAWQPGGTAKKAASKHKTNTRQKRVKGQR